MEPTFEQFHMTKIMLYTISEIQLQGEKIYESLERPIQHAWLILQTFYKYILNTFKNMF